MLKMKKRIDLIIYVYSFHVTSLLRHYGEIQYVSRSSLYVVLALDADRVKEVKARLSHVKNVKRVLDSPISELSHELASKTKRELPNEE